MDGAMAEALAQAEGEQDMDKKIEAALACPCLGDLKEGPCGPTFVHAFGCFIRSEHEDKGMDCLDEFKAFQVCLQKHPEHVARIMEHDDGSGEPGAAAAEAAAGGGGEAAAGTGAASVGAGSSGAAGSPVTQQGAAPQQQHGSTQ